MFNGETRNQEDDRPPKGRGKQSQAAQRPPPDRTTWGQKPKDTSQVGKTWVVASNVQEVIVRDGISTDSPHKYTLLPGQVVTQIGPDEEMKFQGWIVRMEISFTNPESDQVCTGWVTKTAEACKGPRFFYPSRPERQNTNNQSNRDGNERMNHNGAKSGNNRWNDARDGNMRQRNNNIQNPDSGDDADYRSSGGNVASSPISPATNSMFSEKQGVQAAEAQARYHHQGMNSSHNNTSGGGGAHQHDDGLRKHYPPPTSAQQFLGVDKMDGQVAAAAHSTSHGSAGMPHTVDARGGKWGPGGQDTTLLPRHSTHSSSDGIPLMNHHGNSSNDTNRYQQQQLPPSGAGDHWSRTTARGENGGHHNNSLGGGGYHTPISTQQQQHQHESSHAAHMYHPQHGFPPQYAHLGYQPYDSGVSSDGPGHAYGGGTHPHKGGKGPGGGGGHHGGQYTGYGHYGSGGPDKGLKGGNSKASFLKGKGEPLGQFMGI